MLTWICYTSERNIYLNAFGVCVCVCVCLKVIFKCSSGLSTLLLSQIGFYSIFYCRVIKRFFCFLGVFFVFVLFFVSLSFFSTIIKNIHVCWSIPCHSYFSLCNSYQIKLQTPHCCYISLPMSVWCRSHFSSIPDSIVSMATNPVWMILIFTFS